MALSVFLPVAVAQDATPTNAFAEIDLPELQVAVTETGYEGIPDELAAGRYLVTVTVAEELAEFGGGIAFVQPPADMATDEFITAYTTPPDESGVGDAAATPIEGGVATPEAGGLPEFLFTARYAGGAYSFGGPAQVVLDLTPGEWIAWADDPEAAQEPVVFQVTGEMPTELAEPSSNATITMAEYVIEVSEGELTAGPQVVRIDNVGAQPHFVGWFQGPDGMTREQIQTVFDEETESQMTGTPVTYSGLNPDEDLRPVTFTATQSTNTSIWITVDLEAGSHGLACFFPDLGDGLPHANHGMFNVVEVGE
jgi:hypothetical protein